MRTARYWLGATLAIQLVSISASETAQAQPPDPALKAIVTGDHRSEASKARDRFRSPAETLTFFGLKPNMHVVEIWPGGGWYTDIIAPYVKNHGKYYAADRDYEVEDQAHRRGMMRLRNKIEARPELFGKVVITTLSRNKIDIPSNNVAPPGIADMVLTFRNVHNWMKYGYQREVFDAMFRALKPGGILGVVEHREDPKAKPDPNTVSGYVQEEQVKEMAKAAGFVFVRSSEINANPKDTRNHPKGVWTLPPALRLKEKDRDKYLAIGESDRMTLVFRKP